MNDILFRKFAYEDGCSCCDDCGDCECEECFGMTEYEVLDSMTKDELLAFAAETFKARLNHYKDAETLIEEIIDLYVQAQRDFEILQGNLKKKQPEHLIAKRQQQLK